MNTRSSVANRNIMIEESSANTGMYEFRNKNERNEENLTLYRMNMSKIKKTYVNVDKNNEFVQLMILFDDLAYGVRKKGLCEQTLRNLNQSSHFILYIILQNNNN